MVVVRWSSRVKIAFFFSSRRRHTRYWRDWSSDVCSSDLGGGELLLCRRAMDEGHESVRELGVRRILDRGDRVGVDGRSEERRVGKECRSRWWADHEKKKSKLRLRKGKNKNKSSSTVKRAP